MNERSEFSIHGASPFSAEQVQILQSWTTHYPYPMMGLLEALRQVQEWHRCVTREDEACLAGIFKTTVTHVHEVATFYPHFTQQPVGRRRIGLCRGLSCKLKGSDKMVEHVEKALGIKDGETTPDGKVSLETMECLGACDCAPALSVNDELQGEATRESVDKLLSEMR